MNRLFVGFATAALVSGGLVAAGPGAGTAQAIDDCSPAAMVGAICYGPNHWCPGDSLLYLTQNHVYNPVTWDMTVCHTYWHVAPTGSSHGVARWASYASRDHWPQRVPTLVCLSVGRHPFRLRAHLVAQ
jgi:hypothetical protein